MKDFMKVSPLKILEKSSEKALGRGNLGVLMARAGVGKTACLIHIAFDRLFREGRLVHVCLEDAPEKVTSYYNVIFSDLVEAFNMADDEIRTLVEKNRMILAYLNRSFEIARLRENLKNLVEKVNFIPDTLIVDGLDFEATDRKVFEDFKEIASQYNVEIWFSALSHRHITDVNEEGIPYPCDKLGDLFDIIAVLEPASSGIVLRLLKDHGKKIMRDASVNLDPKTFLAINS
jgi:KaiC/GvpD/RAD55 family RecA-like ATPase